MSRYLHHPLLYALISFSIFAILVLSRSEQPTYTTLLPTHDRVVLSAPLLIALYAGDRFLAADIEAIRLSATGIENGQVNTFYLLRAHKVVADLNPCHEDNYYVANALLTWGGAVEEGGDILERATACRYWDELPPFLYGFNQFFFNHKIKNAQKWLEIAAKRSKNGASYRNLAIMIEVEQIDDEKIALDMLKRERARAKSIKLAKMLDRRIARLEGLATLRDAQHLFEQRSGHKLSQPSQLIEAGILKQIPQDPMGIGYEFTEGNFNLKKVRIAGAKERQ